MKKLKLSKFSYAMKHYLIALKAAQSIPIDRMPVTIPEDIRVFERLLNWKKMLQRYEPCNFNTAKKTR